MMPSGVVSPGPESTGEIVQRILLGHSDGAMGLMGGRSHQLCGPVGKHFGASDFEATPAEFDRFDRTVDSRCDDGGLLVDGDQMRLDGLESTDRSPELLTFAAVAQCHCRDGTYCAGHQRRTPQRGALS